MRPASAGAAKASDRTAADPRANAKLDFLFMYLASGTFDDRHGVGFTAREATEGRWRARRPRGRRSSCFGRCPSCAPTPTSSPRRIRRPSLAAAALGGLAVLLFSGSACAGGPRRRGLASPPSALAMVVLSGNAPAALAAAAILGRDGASRRRGVSAARGRGGRRRRPPRGLRRGRRVGGHARSSARRGRACSAPRRSRFSRRSSCFCAGAGYRRVCGSRAPGRAPASRRRAAGARSRPGSPSPALLLLATWAGVLAPGPVLGRARLSPARSARHRRVRARPSAAGPAAAIASLARPRRVSRAGFPLRAGGRKESSSSSSAGRASSSSARRSLSRAGSGPAGRRL